MTSRVLRAALAAIALTGCAKQVTTTYLIEQDGHRAIAVKRNARVEIYPLPERAVVIVGDTVKPIGPDSLQIMPRCPCDRPACRELCMPNGAGWWFDMPIDPVTRPGDPGTDPRQPGGEPGRPGNPDGGPLTRPPQ